VLENTILKTDRIKLFIKCWGLIITDSTSPLSESKEAIDSVSKSLEKSYIQGLDKRLPKSLPWLLSNYFTNTHVFQTSRPNCSLLARASGKITILREIKYFRRIAVIAVSLLAAVLRDLGSFCPVFLTKFD